MTILIQNFSAITTSQLLESRRRRHIIPACLGVHQVAKKLDTTEALELTRHASKITRKGNHTNFKKKPSDRNTMWTALPTENLLLNHLHHLNTRTS
jgi:hypothetical protein